MSHNQKGIITTQSKSKGSIKDRMDQFQHEIQKPTPASRNNVSSKSHQFPTTSENPWNAHNDHSPNTRQPLSTRSISLPNDSNHQIEEHTSPLHTLPKEFPPQPSGHDHLDDDGIPLPLNLRDDVIYMGSFSDDESPELLKEFVLPELPTEIRTSRHDGKINSPGNNVTSKRKTYPPPSMKSKQLNNNTKDVSRNAKTPIQTPQMPPTEESIEYRTIAELLEKTIPPPEKNRTTEKFLALPPPRLPRRPRSPAQNFLQIEGSDNRLEMTSLLRSLLNKDYFHPVNRAKTERLLTTDGMFLIRPSSNFSELNPLSLCVCYDNSTQTFKIKKSVDGSYALGGEKSNEKKFRTIDELVEFYKAHNIVFKIRKKSTSIRLQNPPSKPR